VGIEYHPQNSPLPTISSIYTDTTQLYTQTMKLALKKTYFALSLFAVGSIQLFTARLYTKTTIGLNLALVRNEFLDKPPTKIIVVGNDIHSGHGHEDAATVLRSAFGTDMTRVHDQIYRHDLLDQDELKDVSRNTDILWIMVVRSPCEAADAVIRFQQDACRRNELPSDKCEMHEFATETDYYRMPWYDLHGDSNSGSDDNNNNNDNEGVINIIESKPRQTSKFDDIFDMRRQKLLMMKQIMDAVPRHVKILRLGEFELNSNVFVNDLVKEYEFKLSKKYKPIPPSTDPQSFNPKHIFSCMEYTKWKEAQQRIDWVLEGYFGYNRLDCRLCRDSGQVATSNGGLPITVPSKIYILGERNSGTTFVSNTLAEAFDPPNTMGSNLEKFSSDIPVLLHKHMFRHDLLSSTELAEIRARDDILWVMVVRSTCDWAEAMFRKPYHLCPPNHPERCGPGSDPNNKIWLNQNSLVGVSLLEFFTKFEWNDWAESVPFYRDKVEKKDFANSAVSISKVSANYTYPDVFALRRHKLKIMKQIIDTVPRNVKFVRLKELERSPELFIQSLVAEFNVAVKEGYESQPPSKVAHPTVCLTPHEWDAVQNAVDWKLEAEFGFSPCDCRMCYGYEKSTRLYDRVMRGKKISKIVDKHGTARDIDKRAKAAKLGKKVGEAFKKQEGTTNEKADGGGREINAPTKKQEDTKVSTRVTEEEENVGKARKMQKANKRRKKKDA